MYRIALGYLNDWFHGQYRKPLVIRGARQVGKSTLIRLFAEEYGLSMHAVNLERHLYLDAVFREGDMQRVLGEIEGLTGEIDPSKSTLIFLDEIQAAPHAIQFLRYFYEDRPDLAVVAAGSLLEFALTDHRFSMPVGRVSYLHLGPMSFAEFLMAREPELYRYWETFTLDRILPESYHRRLVERQREYLFCGGMPESVKVLIETDQIAEVQEIHRSIIDTYIDDFAKYARRSDLVRLQHILRSIPAFIGQKIVYSKLSRDDRAAEVRSAVELLAKARVCTQVFHSDCSGIPLEAGKNSRVFKLVFIDCGLMNHLLGLTWRHVQQLHERELVNEGAQAEQFIGQQLLSTLKGIRYPELFYWLREGRSGNAEVDYVIDNAGIMIPVEVKAGKSGSLKSMHQFLQRKGGALALRFNLNYPKVEELEVKAGSGGDDYSKIRFRLVSLPLYFAGRVDTILHSVAAH